MQEMDAESNTQLLLQRTRDEQVQAMILSSEDYFERTHTYP
jgi:hypothetical protein